jgi:hypothetical protein
MNTNAIAVERPDACFFSVTRMCSFNDLTGFRSLPKSFGSRQRHIYRGLRSWADGKRPLIQKLARRHSVFPSRDCIIARANRSLTLRLRTIIQPKTQPKSAATDNFKTGFTLVVANLIVDFQIPKIVAESLHRPGLPYRVGNFGEPFYVIRSSTSFSSTTHSLGRGKPIEEFKKISWTVRPDLECAI